MRKVCGITTSSATAAAMWRTWSGITCLGLPRAPSASGSFANAKSFSGGCARSVRRGTLPVNNSKEDKHMEKELTTAGAPVPAHQEQNMSTETKCPVAGGARRPTAAGAQTNAGWWPDQLNLKILHQQSPLSDPMDKEFNYAEAFKSLDLDAVIKDL